MRKMSVYLINHTLREVDVVNRVSDILTEYDEITGSGHEDARWNKADFIEPGTEEDVSYFKTLWEDNNIEVLVKYFRERNQPKFCCQADGYVGTCCEEKHFIKLLTYEIERREYYTEYLAEYLKISKGCLCIEKNKIANLLSGQIAILAMEVMEKRP